MVVFNHFWISKICLSSTYQRKITKIIHSLPRNLRAGNKSSALFFKKPFCTGHLSLACKILKGLNEGTLKKLFGKCKPSSKLTLKTKWYHSCGCSDDFRSWEQKKKHAADKYFEKKSYTLNPYHFQLQEMYVIITILEWLVSTWCICLTEILEEKHLKIIIWIKCMVLWLLSLLYSALVSSGPQMLRQLTCKIWLGTLGSARHLTPKIEHLQKTKVAFKF